LLDGDFDPVAQYERLYTESVQELVKEKMDNHEKVKEHEEQCWV
jgi:non-homologous end joining protein Ku